MSTNEDASAVQAWRVAHLSVGAHTTGSILEALHQWYQEQCIELPSLADSNGLSTPLPVAESPNFSSSWLRDACGHGAAHREFIDAIL
jgi:hypothetical protein